jgi:hypothetical protein
MKGWVAALIIASASAQACDDRKCLSSDCQVRVNETATLLCADGYEARSTTINDENNLESGYQNFTCCPSGYSDMPLDILQTCSTEACKSPDGKGGYDCSADGFIHPLVCEKNSEYEFARKSQEGNIYSPYICCTQAVDQSNKVMIVAAAIWSALCGITFVACSILIAGILRSKKARGQGYNLYLVFLAIPDALFNLFSLGRNIVNLSGDQLSTGMGSTVHALEWFHTAANMWLNAFIAYQIHSMLLRAQKFMRTSPPTVKQVLWQVAGFYFFALLWAAWSLVLLLQGSNIFTNTNAAWLVSKSLMCGPPFLYTIGACLHVWWKKLLPSQGRTRVLSIYFLRVVIVFLLTWVPFLILVDVTYYKTASLWMLGLAYYFASLQGLLSVIVALEKPDIKRAVTNMLCRRPDDFNETEAGFLDSKSRRLGRSILPSRLFQSSKFGFSDQSITFSGPLSKSNKDESTFSESNGRSVRMQGLGEECAKESTPDVVEGGKDVGSVSSPATEVDDERASDVEGGNDDGRASSPSKEVEGTVGGN